MNTSKASRRARVLMDEHGLHLPAWNFEWDNAKRRFGQCRAQIFFGDVTGTISLSLPLVRLNEEGRVENTILHEIAHALVAKKYQKSGHGREWKKEAVALGIKAVRCYAEDTKTPEARYLAVCPKGHSHPRMKKPKKGRIQSCGICSPVFNSEYQLTFKSNPSFK